MVLRAAGSWWYEELQHSPEPPARGLVPLPRGTLQGAQGRVQFPSHCPPLGWSCARAVPSVLSRCGAWDAFPARQEEGLSLLAGCAPGHQHTGFQPGRSLPRGCAGDRIPAVPGLPPCCWRRRAPSQGFVSSPGQDLVAAQLQGRGSASLHWLFWGSCCGWSWPAPPARSRAGRGSLEGGLTPPSRLGGGAGPPFPAAPAGRQPRARPHRPRWR